MRNQGRLAPIAADLAIPPAVRNRSVLHYSCRSLLSLASRRSCHKLAAINAPPNAIVATRAHHGMPGNIIIGSAKTNVAPTKYQTVVDAGLFSFATMLRHYERTQR